MCQPGRPRPQGESQAVSSSGFCAFQSAKSSGSRLRACSASGSPWSAGSRSSSRRLESLPYSSKLRTLK